MRRLTRLFLLAESQHIHLLLHRRDTWTYALQKQFVDVDGVQCVAEAPCIRHL